MKGSNDVSLQKTTTGIPIHKSTPATSTYKKKVVKELEVMLKDQKQKRQNAEDRLLDYRHRSINIEKDFMRMAQKYDISLLGARKQNVQAKDTFNKIVLQIECFFKKQEQVLQDKCKEMMCMMNRKIDHIISKSESEVYSHEKIKQGQYKMIKDQVREALSISRNIQMENLQLRKIRSTLQFKNSILNQEKNLLVEELHQKKNMILKLYKAIKADERSATPLTSRRSNSKSIYPLEESIFKPSKNKSQSDNFRTMQNPQTSRLFSSFRKTRDESIKKTNDHVKICLEREQRKSRESKSALSNLISRHNEIVLALEVGSKMINDENKLENKCKKYKALLDELRTKATFAAGGHKIGLSEKDVKEILNS